MKKQLDNSTLWNEAARTGALLGLVSVGCLLLRELAAASGVQFLITAATVLLWVTEFFGCILILKRRMLDLRDAWQDVKMADTYRLGRRAALLSGLVLASAQALVVMYMPQETVEQLVSAVSESMKMSASQQEEMSGMMDRLPVLTFLFQWLYCFLYGTVLSGILSRYIFFQKLFGGPFDGPEDKQNTPDEQ